MYSVNSLIEMNGSEFKSKRNLTKQFVKLYDSILLKNISLRSKGVQKSMIELMIMCKKRKIGMAKDYYLDHEIIAFKKLLASQDIFNLTTTGLYQGSSLIGFSIDEIIFKDLALSHFFKVDYDYRGIYDYLNFHTAKKLKEMNIKKWNWVEDLGIENLRKAKMNYGPSRFIKTYIISYK